MVRPFAITEEMKVKRQARLDEAIRKQNDAIKRAVEAGRSKTIVQCYDTASEGDLFPEIKLLFEAAGYTIKPTGRIGGVEQRTMDIYW